MLGGSLSPVAAGHHRHQQGIPSCVTYEELAEITGEPLREVNFGLPSHCIPALRKCRGFEDFDPRTEVLHCVKPGTGCNDAPRCFCMKLGNITRGACGMMQCTIYNELLFLHRKNDKGEQVLLPIMCIYVDDLKLTGRRTSLSGFCNRSKKPLANSRWTGITSKIVEFVIAKMPKRFK